MNKEEYLEMFKIEFPSKPMSNMERKVIEAIQNIGYTPVCTREGVFLFCLTEEELINSY